MPVDYFGPLAIQTFAGTGQPGYTGDGGPALEATIREPFMCDFDPAGNLYVCEAMNHVVRRIDARTGVITTVAGTGELGCTGDGGPALQATFHEPYSLAIAPNGDVIVTDTENHAIRHIERSSGLVNTIAGGRLGGHGDGGPARDAGLDRPHGCAVAPDGTIYIADSNNHRIRVVSPAAV